MTTSPSVFSPSSSPIAPALFATSSQPAVQSAIPLSQPIVSPTVPLQPVNPITPLQPVNPITPSQPVSLPTLSQPVNLTIPPQPANPIIPSQPVTPITSPQPVNPAPLPSPSLATFPVTAPPQSIIQQPSFSAPIITPTNTPPFETQVAENSTLNLSALPVSQATPPAPPQSVSLSTPDLQAPIVSTPITHSEGSPSINPSIEATSVPESQKRLTPVDNTSTDLYRKYRPQALADFHGQPAAVHSVSQWFSDPKSPCPQAILITGPTGTGKSTLARIIATMLDATTAFDYMEINIGEENGIDLIRSLSERVQYRSHTGKNRVFFLDETALMRNNAQQALLKLLEQLPPKIYIILATTHPQKLESTVRNRCVTLALKSLDNNALLASLNTVLAAEQRTLEPEVVSRLIETSGGSGRQLMTSLQRILTSDKSAGQLLMLSEVDTPVEGEISKKVGYVLAGWNRVASWHEFRSLLGQLDFKATSPETLRNYVLSCLKTALLKSDNPDKIARMIHVFRNPYFNSADGTTFLADAFFAYSVLTQ